MVRISEEEIVTRRDQIHHRTDSGVVQKESNTIE
jgi:hypothetical protein